MAESKEDSIKKAIKEGFALVVYQDESGVHIGVIDNEAILEARGRKITDEEAEGHDVIWHKNDERQGGDEYYCQGWLDTKGGSIEKLDSFSIFEGPWTTICEMLVDED